MITIWKYQLKEVMIQKFLVPSFHKWIRVGVQNRTPCLWAIIDTETQKQSVSINIVSTGESLNFPIILGSGGNYLGTFELNGLVWHVFEVQ